MTIPLATHRHLRNHPLTLPGRVQAHVDLVHQQALLCTVNPHILIILLDTRLDRFQARHGLMKSTETEIVPFSLNGH